MDALNLPETIPIGIKGWKVREIERLIIEIVNRSSNPQSGWTVCRKLHKKKLSRLKCQQIKILMGSLCECGFLEFVKNDEKQDRTYKIPTKKE